MNLVGYFSKRGLRDQWFNQVQKITYSTSILLNIGAKIKRPILPTLLFKRLQYLQISRIMPRMCRGGKQTRERHIITTHRNRPSQPAITRGVNISNLKPIAPSCNIPEKYITIGCINTRSVKNKEDDVVEAITDNNIDILAITETWLTAGDRDNMTRKSMTPQGHQLFDKARKCRRGGGVAIVCKDSLTCKEQQTPPMTSCELLELLINVRLYMLRVAVIYRPPSSSKTGMPIGTFLEEFHSYIDSRVTMSGKFLVLGDFNFHFEQSHHPDTIKLRDLIYSLNLRQHVQEPTHIHGHALDLVISREDEVTVTSVDIHPPTISDHSLITFTIPGTLGHPTKKKITFRKLNNINIDSFENDIRASTFVTNPGTNIDDLARQFFDLRTILNLHSPLMEKEIVDRSSAPWFNEECKAKKTIKRTAERRYRKHKTAINQDILNNAVEDYKKTCMNAKTKFFQSKIVDCQGNQKSLFKIVNSLLHRTKDTSLPSYTNPSTLANEFANFFKTKIDNICKEFSDDTVISNEPSPAVNHLEKLDEVNEEKVKKIITESNNKYCSLDAIPTPLLKTVLDPLLPSITKMINASITESKFPTEWKTAIVTPLLKKPTADSEDMPNYRPVSNLSFISKITEKLVLNQIDSHLETQSLLEPNQSAYRKFHSTETALVKIQNDLLLEMDNRTCVVLILLDMSAAFDTISHSILLNRLNTKFSITGNANKWLESYFTNRSQRVIIDGFLSDSVDIACGMPQGSILGPKGYPLYVTPIFNIANKHNVKIHMYADDTQLYLSFYPADWPRAKAIMESCVSEVRSWLTDNHLKLNDNKTEVMIVGKENVKSKIQGDIEICIGSEKVKPKSCVRNLGAFLDSELSMQEQVKSTSRSCYSSLHSLGRIRKYLDENSVKTLVHAFITCKIDNLNSLLPCVSDHVRTLNKLQMILNTSARLIFRLRKHDHITPVLMELHWLPIQARIDYKILLLTYKALNGIGPSYLVDFLHPKQYRRNTRAANDYLALEAPSTKMKTVGDKSFSFTSVYLWNCLPLELRSSPSLSIFKSNLKTYLFRRAYQLCDITA